MGEEDSAGWLDGEREARWLDGQVIFSGSP